MSSSTAMLNGAQVNFSRQQGTGNLFQGQWNDQLVAVKVLQDNVDLDGLLSRVQHWKSLQHLHVAQILDAGDDGNEIIIISPLCSVGNIRQYLNMYPNLDRPKLIYEIGLGMQFLHSQNIIHGSLRPSNVLISDDGNPVLSDYGLVELQPTGCKDAHRYWSPEAWKGAISTPSDVYAFAMTAYEIFTSTPPWGYLSQKHIYQLVAYEDSRPDRPDQQLELRVGLTDSMWGLMNESWDREPRLRPTFDIIVRVWGSQIVSPSNIGFPGLSRSQSIPSPTSSGHHGHRTARSFDDVSSIHSYASGPPAYEAEFPHLMPGTQNNIPPPIPSSTAAYAYASMLPPSVAPLVASSYHPAPQSAVPPESAAPPPPPPILPGLEEIRPLQIPARRGGSSPRRSQSAISMSPTTRLGQFGRMPSTQEETGIYTSPIASRSMTSLGMSPPPQPTLPPVPTTVGSWREQMLTSMSLEPTRSRPNSRNELQTPSRPPSRSDTDRPSSRSSHRRAGSREPSDIGESKRSESPYRTFRVTNNVSSAASSSATSSLSKHLSNASSFKSIASYNLRPTINTTPQGTPISTPLASRFPDDLDRRRTVDSVHRRPGTSTGSPPSSLAFASLALPEEQSPDEEPRHPMQYNFTSPPHNSPPNLPLGAASVLSPPQQLQAETRSQFFNNPNSPGWDVQSVLSDTRTNTVRPNGASGAASLAASTNAVALVGVLQTAINNTGALSSPLEFGSSLVPEEEDEDPEGEVDFALIKIHALACQSEKDAQRLVTAGLVPVLLGLVSSRFKAAKEAKRKGPELSGRAGKGLEMVLITLGMIAYDSITANIIFRTGTITTLIDIFSAFSASSTIEEEAAQREQIATLALWCLNRICRSAEIANGLIKADLVGVLISKTLRTGFAHSYLIGRYGAWLLGNLMFTDAIAESMDVKYGIVAEVVDYLRRVVGRSTPSSAPNANGPPPAPPSPEDVSAALFPLARLSRTTKLSKALTIGVKTGKNAGTDMGVILLLSSILSTSTDPALLGWASRTVGCLIRPNSAEVARAMLDGGIGAGLSRVPRVLTTEEALGLTSNSNAPAPLASFAFTISRFSCAEWGAGIRKRLVEDGVVDSLLSALRTASDEPCPDVHIELALAVSFLGDVGGRDIRKEVIRAGGIEILKQVAEQAKQRQGEQAERIAKVCGMAITSITGNIWTRNAASAKTAMTHDWTGGCPEYQPPCPFSIDIQEDY